MNTLRKFGPRTVVLGSLVPMGAMAAVDTAAVTAAGADALLYAAAVAGVLVSIWAAKLAYRKFFGG